MNTALPAPMPDPVPGEVARGLAALEAHLAEAAPEPVAPDPSPAPVEAEDTPEVPKPVEERGETERVRQLRAEVAEAALIAELQADDTPLRIDTPKVRKRRKKANEAARLHELAQDPAARAWQAARMRRLLVAGAMVSLALALAWSTAGVQAFAAEGAPMWSPGWIFAWFVEPFLSLALLVVVGARAYMGTRGQPIRSKALTGIEVLFLALTLGMNAFPHLPGVATEFKLPALVLHVLGPIVAVAIVTALPIILEAFTRLDHGAAAARPTAPTPGPTAPEYSGNAASEVPAIGSGVRAGVGLMAAHRARLRSLIAAGRLPAAPSASAIQKALGCGTDTARALRDELAGGAA